MKTPAPVSVLLWLITLGCVASLAGYLGRYFFLFEQIDSFRVQYFMVAVLGVLLALYYRQWLIVVVLVGVSTLHASELARFYRPLPAADLQVDSESANIRVMSVNLLASNRDNTLLLAEIERINPDLIVFQEYTSWWHQALSVALVDYPHRLHKIINTPFGIAAYSRLPYQQQSIEYFNQKLSPAVDVRIDVDGLTVRVLGIHPVPPMSATTYSMRNRYYSDVAEQAANSNIALIVLGDFNATPWSYHFTRLLKRADLRSTRDGAGIHPTWPGSFWPLWTPIDHIIHNQRVRAVRFESGAGFGSDHKPVWADLSIVGR
ncbi:MAG: endonuclease/exonuclease/phosphatase family protein [Pseudomonadota bacterium]